MNVEAIKAFDDNYIWLLTESDSAYCAVVDPGDEEPVIERIEQLGLQLSAILITHKHYDHTGGVKALKKRWPEVLVFGPGDESIDVVQLVVKENDTIALPHMDFSLKVMQVPGHTEGHVAYLSSDNLFCGDTLFAGGCGRVFTGTFEQMTHSLARIRQLPGQTKVFCAHEYTQANLGFASWVEPDSPAILARVQMTNKMREQNLATVPSVLADELETNPFLRVNQPGVIAAAQKWAGKSLTGEVDVFTALRQWKDQDYD